MTKIILEKLEELDFARNEAYKTLRTNLSFCGADVRRVLITSSTPNEGKSTISFQLARALAEDNKRVILIDADLRKSVLLGRLGARREDHKEIKGLSHYLTGQAALQDVLCDTNIPGLQMIFSGPATPNPTELLGCSYMEGLIQNLEQHADYIIVDAPPLGSVVDALILTRQCDGAILVVENNRISYRLAQSVKKQLEQGNCRLLGAVLNKVDIEKGGYYQGYYKKYYGGYGYEQYERD